ncbi:putative RNA-directed DNA polymerase [Helianthus annuus]|nr:putative RNA-directed DNA polymerase [Helianthus annuus]
MALQEIQFNDISGIVFEKFWGVGNFEMDHVPAVGRSGGVVSIWDPSVFKVHVSIKHSNFLLTIGELKGSNKKLNIINVYAPQIVTQKKALWDEIGVVMGNHSGRWVILGDFNAVRRRDERKNSIFNKNCASNFNNFIFDNGLREYDMKGRKFTYLYDNGNKLSKIDRVLVCQDFFSDWPMACLRALPRIHSDHCPIVLLCADKNFGPKPFRIFNSWMERKDFDDVVNKATGKVEGGGEPDVMIMKKFRAIREDIKKWKKTILAKEGDTERVLKEDLEKLDELSDIRELSEEEEWSKAECVKDIKELEGFKIKDLKQRARIKWDMEEDENSAFFHGYINSRRACNNIPGLMIDGEWTTKPTLVKKEVMGFFRNIFKEKIMDRPKLTCYNLKRLAVDEAASLIIPFSKEEIKSAVFECGADKAPGPDGFNFKFIKRYWSLFENDFSNMLASFYSKGNISEGCGSSFITLIPKNKDPLGLKDYRPINLIGVISYRKYHLGKSDGFS